MCSIIPCPEAWGKRRRQPLDPTEDPERYHVDTARKRRKADHSQAKSGQSVFLYPTVRHYHHHTRCPSSALGGMKSEYLRDSVGVNQNLGPFPLRHFYRLLLLGRGRGGHLQRDVGKGAAKTQRDGFNTTSTTSVTVVHRRGLMLSGRHRHREASIAAANGSMARGNQTDNLGTEPMARQARVDAFFLVTSSDFLGLPLMVRNLSRTSVSLARVFAEGVCKGSRIRARRSRAKDNGRAIHNIETFCRQKPTTVVVADTIMNMVRVDVLVVAALRAGSNCKALYAAAARIYLPLYHLGYSRQRLGHRKEFQQIPQR